VLTGKRQRQPGGKQGEENQRGGHGEGISMGKKMKAADARKDGREQDRRCLMAIFALREYARNASVF